MIPLEVKVLDVTYTDIGVVKKLMGWSWSDMGSYLGVEKSLYRKKYNGYSAFTKSDRALIWTLWLIAINK